GAQQGAYLVDISLLDMANNWREVSESQLLGLSLPYSVNQTGPSEGAPPEITGVTATPSSVNTCSAPQTVNVNVAAAVAPTNVTATRVVISGPAGQQVTTSANLASGTVKNGTWNAVLTLPRYSHDGTWV